MLKLINYEEARNKISKVVKVLLWIVIILSFSIFFYSLGNVHTFKNLSFKNIKESLEIINYLTPTLVLVVAILGLEQIRLTKKIANKTFENELDNKTIEQCQHFMEDITEKIILMDAEMERLGITDFGEAVINLETKVITSNSYIFNDKKYDEIIPYALRVLNSCDTVAMCFMLGKANVNKAFEAIGVSYVHNISRLLPALGEAQPAGHYKNLIDLYVVWRKKLEEV